MSDSEKQQVDADLEADERATPAKRHHSMGAALREPKVYVAALVHFSIICGTNAIALWMPTIIKEAGIGDLSLVGLLAGLAWTAAALGRSWSVAGMSRWQC